MVRPGNMTLRGRASAIEKGSFICEECRERFQQSGARDESFSDGFGEVTDWQACCPYCGGEYSPYKGE